ncbi:fructose-6-phosphate aldolase [Clostridium frigidicarnis]|uniref:Probable transaldolase n=1 Tax=Clostridium frigidicarnis TaxID=84698 RepID=A0A1I0ZX76_9CLOT|nr:fructose-6-phosphate aldolase [Clostridium frigidicarnis]SFB29040.1 transaldolase [Clostridium frigidicarnis]
MKLFIDTANIEEIRNIAKLGIVSGVTTNPTLIAREGRDITEAMKEITSLIDGPISAEVMALESDKMVEEAKELIKIHKNIVIKIPMCEEGLKAVSELSKLGIKTNVTLIFSAVQALLAARAGASFVSPFVGRLDDIGAVGNDLIVQIREMFDIHGIDAEIISASIRTPMHVHESALAGAHISTVPYKILLQMIKHPLTDIGMEKFIADYNKAFNK